LLFLFVFRAKYAYYLKFAILAVYSFTVSFLLLPISLFRPRNTKNASLAHWCITPLGRLIGFYPTKFEGKAYLRLEGPAIIIANHQCYMDLVGIANVWPNDCAVLAKRSLLYMGPVGLLMWLCGTIFIVRDDRNKALHAMSKVARIVKENQTKVFIFPEGTRGPGDTLLPFKKGAFFLAVEAQIPIIPIVFSNYHSALDHEKKIFNSSGFEIKVLPPIPTKGLTKDDVTALTDKARDLMLQVYHQNDHHIPSHSSAASSQSLGEKKDK